MTAIRVGAQVFLKIGIVVNHGYAVSSSSKV